MISIERILCPVDLSEFSERALRHAIALAGWYRAEVIALAVRPTVLPTAPWMEYPASLPAEAPEAREQESRAVISFVNGIAGATPVQVIVKQGPVVAEILRTAAELPADLIVMGTHGLSGFERLLLGSVTEKVLRKAPCPVLCVPPSTAARAEIAVVCRMIVCGIDFSPASRRAFEYALSLAQEADGRLVLVHVLEWFAEEETRLTAHVNIAEFRRTLEENASAQLAALIPEDARSWCDPELVLEHGKAYRQLLRVATERSADLLVLGVQGRGAVDLMLFGSTTQHVLRQAQCPVLTVSA